MILQGNLELLNFFSHFASNFNKNIRDIFAMYFLMWNKCFFGFFMSYTINFQFGNIFILMEKKTLTRERKMAKVTMQLCLNLP